MNRTVISRSVYDLVGLQPCSLGGFIDESNVVLRIYTAQALFAIIDRAKHAKIGLLRDGRGWGCCRKPDK